jgi:hypothetical protein
MISRNWLSANIIVKSSPFKPIVGRIPSLEFLFQTHRNNTSCVMSTYSLAERHSRKKAPPHRRGRTLSSSACLGSSQILG